MTRTSQIALYERDVERQIVRAHLVGRKIVWIVVGDRQSDSYDPDHVYRRSYDGENVELSTFYGLAKRSVTTRILPPKGKGNGRYALVDCRIELTHPGTRRVIKYPLTPRGWNKLYLTVKSAVLSSLTWIDPEVMRKARKKAKAQRKKRRANFRKRSSSRR